MCVIMVNACKEHYTVGIMRKMLPMMNSNPWYLNSGDVCRGGGAKGVQAHPRLWSGPHENNAQIRDEHPFGARPGYAPGNHVVTGYYTPRPLHYDIRMS